MRKLFRDLKWIFREIHIYPKYVSYSCGRKAIYIRLYKDHCAINLTMGNIRRIKVGHRILKAKFISIQETKEDKHIGIYEVNCRNEYLSIIEFCDLIFMEPDGFEIVF